MVLAGAQSGSNENGWFISVTPLHGVTAFNGLRCPAGLSKRASNCIHSYLAQTEMFKRIELVAALILACRNENIQTRSSPDLRARWKNGSLKKVIYDRWLLSCGPCSP